MYEVSVIHFGVQYGMAPSDSANLVLLCDKSKYYREGEEVELMQYTGLNDSKGQEIYEGDIIKAGLSKRGIVGPFVGRVYWCESEFQWWITDDKNNPVIGIDYDLSFLSSYQDFEVIGNIYEHHELLKQKR